MPTHQAATALYDGLWEAICQQEPAGHERLDRAVRTICEPLLRRKGVNSSDLDDLLQEVLLSTWMYAGNHDAGPTNFPNFLRWRARGVFKEYLRGLRQRERLQELDLPIDTDDDATRPWDALFVKELQGALSSCVSELDGKYQRAWRARYDADLAPSDAAKALGIGTATVATHFFRARQHLAACLKRRQVLR